VKAGNSKESGKNARAHNPGFMIDRLAEIKKKGTALAHEGKWQ